MYIKLAQCNIGTVYQPFITYKLTAPTACHDEICPHEYHVYGKALL